MLLKRDPANPAPAEEAFLTAIAVAKQQGTRSFELRAALSLAKLYQSTGRPADAHAVLAPALEGFAPTPEMPEIAEAQALLAALAETDEIKSDAARREQRAKLHLGMAVALLQSRGMKAPETRAAFEQAGDTAAEVSDPMERLAILYGNWMGEFARGDVRRMLEIAPSVVAVAALEPTSSGRSRRPSGSSASRNFWLAIWRPPMRACDGPPIITNSIATAVWRSGSDKTWALRRDTVAPSSDGCLATERLQVGLVGEAKTWLNASAIRRPASPSSGSRRGWTTCAATMSRLWRTPNGRLRSPANSKCRFGA